MKVTSIDVHILENREGYGLAADGEESLGPRFVSVIQVNTDEGISGIADCDSHPHVIRAFLEAPRNIPGFSEGLQYAVVGEDPFQLEKIRRKMYDVSYYHGRTGAVIQAMSAIDIALWDILGKVCRRSVSEIMGARQHERIRAYASTLFRSTPDAMRRAVNAYRERGYTAIKFGWGVFTESPYAALKLVEAARSEAGEDLDLMVDGLWTRDVSLAIDIVKRLEALGVFFVEEPLVSDNLAGYRALRGAVSMRIAAGEQLGGIEEFRRLIDQGQVDIVQPDISRAGGLSEVRLLVNEVERAGKLLVPHAWTSDILTAVSLHLNAYQTYPLFQEFCTNASPLSRDLVTEPLRLEADGFIQVPRGHGLGVELNPETIAKFAVESLTLRGGV